MNISIVRISAVLGLCAVALGTSCNGQTSSGKGSETSWLTTCTSDGDCRVGQCVCGTCTLPCDSNSACPGGTDPDTCATSGSSTFSTLCGAPVTGTGICVSGCGGGTPCPNGFECVDGACLPATGTVTSGISAAASGTFTYFHDTILPTDVISPAKCLPGTLPVGPDGSLSCRILKFSPGDVCDCSSPGLAVPDPKVIAPMTQYLQAVKACGVDSQPPCPTSCACEVQPFGGAQRTSCLNDTAFNTTDAGFCYVDPSQALGSPTVVEQCPPNQKQVLRVGGTVVQDDMYIIACIDRLDAADNSAGLGRVGASCIPSEEHEPAFPGRRVTEVGVDLGSGDCASRVCLVNHFQGRVTCPYGQDPYAPPSPDNTCFTPPPGNEPVTVVVDPQIVQPVRRRPEDAVYCSCRCDGPDKNADYCQCPGGFECAPLIDDLGVGMAAVTGSYCVKVGTEVSNPWELRTGLGCIRPNCGP